MEAISVSQPKNIDIAIIGAGPQALTLLTHLLQKRKTMQGRFLVFDPSGRWIAQWQAQFAALEIPHLRSPIVHHPHPNPYALRGFAESRRDQVVPPYDLPGTQLFEQFCQKVIQDWQLQDCIVPAKVTRIEPLPERARFKISLENQQSAIARRVVLATGGGKAYLPEWTSQIETPYPSDRLCHSQQVDLRSLQLQGERVLIVGGGLTSGHLAMGAIARGANVLLMARRDLQEKLFDAEPGWLGPKYLKGFWAEPDWNTRWELVQKARNGGSMTPIIMRQLRQQERSGKLRFYERCEVIEAQWLGNAWQVTCNNGEIHECDRIWLATGSRFDITTEPLFKDVLETYPVPIINGLPVLDKHLRWSGCELFVMGGFAALEVGPVARNIFGGRMASERIVPALIKPSLQRYYAKSA